MNKMCCITFIYNRVMFYTVKIIRQRIIAYDLPGLDVYCRYYNVSNIQDYKWVYYFLMMRMKKLLM